MSGPGLAAGRRYFKRPHPVIRFLASGCLVLAFVLSLQSGFLLSMLLKDPGISLSSLQAQGNAWILWVPALPVLAVLIGVVAPRFHRGVFLELEPRTVTVYWGWSLPFGKAWPWWRVGARSPDAGADAGALLEVHYLYPGKPIAAYTLVLSGGEAPLVLFWALGYSDTRDLAEQIASLLKLRLQDSTEEDFDREDFDREVPEAAGGPGGTVPRTASSREGETWVVYLPARRPIPHHTQLLVKLLGIGGSAAALSLLIPWLGDTRSAWFTVPVALAVVGGMLFHEYTSGSSHVLRGSRDGLVMESESPFGRKARRFSRADVRQIGVVIRGEHPGDRKKPREERRILSSLLVRGSGFHLLLGDHLPRAELQARARELRAALGLEQEGTPSV